MRACLLTLLGAMQGKRRVRLMPPYCVEHTPGCRRPAALKSAPDDVVILMGRHSKEPPHSMLYDVGRAPTHLLPKLFEAGVGRVVICGLAAETTLTATVADAKRV